MKNTVIRVENLSKYYRLGLIGRGTLREDLNRWADKLRGRKAPTSYNSGALSGREDGEIWALNGVNFDVKQGEILAIIGGNGAGKSTLLKILSKITAPTDGVIKIKGRVGSLLEVGTGFHEELTGRENVYLNGAILGMSREEVNSKLDEIIDFAEMTQFIDTPVKRYSSGMRVRLAFSVAAHLEPEILIIDEVLAVGDIEFQNKCIGKMESVADNGRTVLFVSHNMNTVQNLCTRGIVIDQGRVVFDGSIKDAISQYMNSSTDILDISKVKFQGRMHTNIGFNQIKINGQPLAKDLQASPSEAVSIELSGQCQTEVKDAEIFISLYADGFLLATIFDEESTKELKAGAFISTLSVPPKLLQPGKYTIKIGAQSVRLKESMVSDYIASFSVSPTWSVDVQERKIGPINILNQDGGRIQDHYS